MNTVDGDDLRVVMGKNGDMKANPSPFDSLQGEKLYSSVWQPDQRLQEHLCSTSIRSIDERKSTSIQGVKGWFFLKLRDIYRNRLKQYLLVRTLVWWSWYIVFPFYQRYILVSLKYLRGGEGIRWRSLIALSDFVTNRGLRKQVLGPVEKLVHGDPAVFPAEERACFTTVDEREFFPELSIVAISAAQVYGATNLVLVGDDVICHDLFDCQRDATSEELHRRSWLQARAKRIRWLRNDEFPVSVPAAALFTDACAQNYAHWISEVLPRVALFCSETRYKDVPIIVDAHLHENIMDSLLLVAGLDREIITLPINRGLNVGLLYVTSVTGYVPFGQRKRRWFELYRKKLTGHSQGVFSSKALGVMRERINSREVQDQTDNDLPSKIFLRRRVGVRSLVNSDEVEAFFTDQGFLLVEMENLTFQQQLQLFRHAEIVVSPTGAALANALFCRSGAQVVVLMAKHEEMIYRYWANMLNSLNVGVSYVLGGISKNRDLGIHGDFSVDVRDLKNCLRALSVK